MGWLLLKKRPEVVAAGRKLDLSDLLADPVVMLQQRLNPWWNVFWCFGVPTLVPVLCWGESLLAAYFVPGVLRYLATLHATWLVNSLAHLCEGGRPYDPKQNPAECKIASFFTMGEGWHNWHHAFPFDYAASELGVSKQWNPTKLFIDACCALGLAGGRKRASDVWGKRREKLLAEAAAKGHAVIDTLSGPPLFKQRDITVG